LHVLHLQILSLTKYAR